MKRNPRYPAITDPRLPDPLGTLRRALGGDEGAVAEVARAWGEQAPGDASKIAAVAWYKNALLGWIHERRSPLTVRSYTRTLVSFWDWVARSRFDRQATKTLDFVPPHDLNVGDVVSFVAALAGTDQVPTSWECVALLGRKGKDADTVAITRAIVEVAYFAWTKNQGASLTRDELVAAVEAEFRTEGATALENTVREWADNPAFAVAPQLARECQKFDWICSKLVIAGYMHRDPTYAAFIGEVAEDGKKRRSSAGKYPPYPYKAAVYRRHPAGEGVQPTTVAQRLACLASFWKRLLAPQMNARMPEWLSFNPWLEHLRTFDREGKAARPSRIVARKPSVTDLRKLMNCLYDLGASKAQPSVRQVLARRDMLAVLMMTLMGLRVSEMCGLRRSSLRPGTDAQGQPCQYLHVRRKGAQDVPMVMPAAVAAAQETMLGAMRSLLKKYGEEADSAEIPVATKQRRGYYMAVIRAYLGSREVPFVPAFARWGNAKEKTLAIVSRIDSWDQPRQNDAAQWEGMGNPLDPSLTDGGKQYLLAFVPWEADGVRKMLHDYVPRIADGEDETAMRLRLHPHGLRHLHAALAQRAGMSLEAIQASLGHASPATSRLYMDLTLEDQQRAEAAENALAAIMGATPPAAPTLPRPRFGLEGVTPLPGETPAPPGEPAASPLVPPTTPPAPRRPVVGGIETEGAVVRPGREPGSGIVPGGKGPQKALTVDEAMKQARDKEFPPGSDPVQEKAKLKAAKEEARKRAAAAAKQRREARLKAGLEPEVDLTQVQTVRMPPLGEAEQAEQDAFEEWLYGGAKAADSRAVQPPPADPPAPRALSQDEVPVPTAPPEPTPTPAASQPAPTPTEGRPAKAPKAPREPKAPKAPKEPKAAKPGSLEAIPPVPAALPPPPPPPAPPVQPPSIIAVGTLYRDRFPDPYFPPGSQAFYAGRVLPAPRATLDAWERAEWVVAYRVVGQVDLPPAWTAAKAWTGMRTLLPYVIMSAAGEAEEETAGEETDPEREGWTRMKPNARGVSAGERVAMPVLRLGSQAMDTLAEGVRELFELWAVKQPSAARALPLWVGAMFTHAMITQHRVTASPMHWIGFDEEAPTFRGSGDRASFLDWRSGVRGNVAREHDPDAIVGWLRQNAQTWHGPIEGVTNLSTILSRAKAAAETTAEGFATVLDYLSIVRGEHPAAHGLGLHRYPVPAWMTEADPIAAMVPEDRADMTAWLRKTLPTWSNTVVLTGSFGSPLDFEPLLRPFVEGRTPTIVVPADLRKSYSAFTKVYGVDPALGCQRTVRVLWEIRKTLKQGAHEARVTDAWGVVFAWILPSLDEVESHLANSVGEDWRGRGIASIKSEFDRVVDLNMIVGLMVPLEKAIDDLMRQASKIVGRDPTKADLDKMATAIARAVWHPLSDQFAAASPRDRAAIIRARDTAFALQVAAGSQAAAARGVSMGADEFTAALADPDVYRPETWPEWSTWDDTSKKARDFRAKKLKSLGFPADLVNKPRQAVKDKADEVRALVVCVRTLVEMSTGPLDKLGDRLLARLTDDERRSGLTIIDVAEIMATAKGETIAEVQDKETSGVVGGRGRIVSEREDTGAQDEEGGGKKAKPKGATDLYAEKTKKQKRALSDDEAVAALYAEMDPDERRRFPKDLREKYEAIIKARGAESRAKKGMKPNLAPGAEAAAGTLAAAPLWPPPGWGVVKGLRLDIVRVWHLLTTPLRRTIAPMQPTEKAKGRAAALADKVPGRDVWEAALDALTRELAAATAAVVVADYVVAVHTQSETNSVQHWSTVHARRKVQHETMMAQTLFALGRNKVGRGGLATLDGGRGYHILLTRIGGRKMDPDGLAAAMKGVQDGVAKGLGIDDGSDRLSWRYAQAPDVRKKVLQVRVTITVRTGAER